MMNLFQFMVTPEIFVCQIIFIILILITQKMSDSEEFTILFTDADYLKIQKKCEELQKEIQIVKQQKQQATEKMIIVKQKNALLNEKNEKIVQENRQLQSEIKALKENNQKIQCKINFLMKKLEGLTNQNKDFQKLIYQKSKNQESLLINIKEVKSQFMALKQKSLMNQEKIQKLEMTVQQKCEQLKQSKKEIEKLNQSIKATDSLKNQFKKLQITKDELSSVLQKKQKNEQILKKQINHYVKEISNLSGEIDFLKINRKDFEQKYNQMKAELRELEENLVKQNNVRKKPSQISSKIYGTSEINTSKSNRLSKIKEMIEIHFTEMAVSFMEMNQTVQRKDIMEILSQQQKILIKFISDVCRAFREQP